MNRVKERREQASLTQEQLAKSAKVDRSYLSELETGKGNPTMKTLTKLAAALNCEVKDLIQTK